MPRSDKEHLHPEGFYNRSLERALKILCVFTQDRQKLSLNQLSQLLGLPKATLLRLCSTLITYDFLGYDQATKHYSLGLKLFELGGVVLSSFSFRKVASPYLVELQSKLGKTVFLGILEGDELVYIDKKENPRNPIRFGSQAGQHRPPHFGMLGQTLMAFMPDHEVDRLLQKSPLMPITKRSITNEKQFKARLTTISDQGFAIDEGEAIDGISGVAAPIRNFTGKVVASLGVGFISSSEDQKALQRITKNVLQTARAISQELGWVHKKRRAGAAIDPTNSLNRGVSAWGLLHLIRPFIPKTKGGKL